MAPIEAQTPAEGESRALAQRPNSSSASALEQGTGGGGGGADDDDRADVPSVFKRNAKKRCNVNCISPHTMCAFICGVLVTLIIAALARSPIQEIATSYLCEPAGTNASERGQRRRGRLRLGRAHASASEREEESWAKSQTHTHKRERARRGARAC